MAGEGLRGKTALITGAARRIGRETALALAAEGANIVVHYHRSEEEAQSLLGELRERGVSGWPVRADFGQPSEYESLIARAREAAGGLDILVNNASIFPSDDLETITWENLAANVQVNAWVPFVLSREFARQVGEGKIINLLDTRTAGYDWSHVSYLLSKHLLGALTRMTAYRYAPGIAVNAVAPGLILPPPGKDESYLERLKDTVLLHRHGEPEDVAQAVVFLAKSDYLVGEVIYVDGGRHLMEPGDGSHPDK